MTSERYARGFSEMAEVYVDLTDRARQLLALAHVSPGGSVLDVGCGPGTVARLASEVVGDDGRVVAVDLAPGMLARAAHELGTSAAVAAMDARRLAFADATFDVVVANSVLQFSGPGSLPEWRRVTRRGHGRVACSLPHGPQLWFDLCRDHVHHTAEPFRSTVTARLEAAARPPDPEAARVAGGFAGVEVEILPLVRRYPSAEAAWASEQQHGARVFIEELPSDARRRFEADYLERVGATGDGISAVALPFEFHFWCFTLPPPGPSPGVPAA